jgi:RNA polymerase subunit RPABC4/transcription elongation factor Spt4
MHYMRFVSQDMGIETWRCPMCGREEEHDLWQGVICIQADGDLSAAGHNIYLRSRPQEPEIRLPEPFATLAEAHGIR